ncbi:unnamed protein product [Ophioblennius macclurei]
MNRGVFWEMLLRMRRKLTRCLPAAHRSSLLLAFLLLILFGAALSSLLPSGEPRNGAEDEEEERREREAGEAPDELGGGGLVELENPAEEEGEAEAAAVGEEQFTIVVQTFNRTDILLRLLNHYKAAPHLQRIVVVWNNLHEATPAALWESLGPHPVPVVFATQDANLMRNRLQVFPQIETDAVFMLDDDTLISFPDLAFAFTVWKQFPEQIVGFVPRKHIAGPGGVYSYGSFESRNPELGGGDEYSMVLIGAAFFRRQYLQLFQDQPEEVHRLVDETQNCDDIAMNFAVALHLKRRSPLGGPCRPSGVFVKPVDVRNLEKQAASGYLGMWYRPEHMLQRSYCLNRLAAVYSTMPLCFSNLMVAQFGFPKYANHKTRD